MYQNALQYSEGWNVMSSNRTEEETNAYRYNANDDVDNASNNDHEIKYVPRISEIVLK